MALQCPYCHKKIQIPESETGVSLFPCPNCGGSIDLVRIAGYDDDSKVVYLSDGDIIDSFEAGDEVSQNAPVIQGPPVHPKPRHLHLFRWLAVILGLIMLIPLIGGYFFLESTKSQDQVISYLNSYFSEIDNQNYRKAFRKYIASDLQKKISFEGYFRELEEIRRKLGRAKRREIMRWSYQSINRAKICTLKYTSLYERGNAEECYTLVKARDEWKISEFRIDPHPIKPERGMFEI